MARSEVKERDWLKSFEEAESTMRDTDEWDFFGKPVKEENAGGEERNGEPCV